MFRNKALIALVALGVSVEASSVDAQARTFTGSDTLFDVTRDLVTNSGLSVGLYLGQGSSQGGADMNASRQQISPQSRFLSNAECGAGIAAGAAGPGQGLRIGLDGIAIVRGTGNHTNNGVGADVYGANCNTIRNTDAGGNGVALGGYSLPADNWRDVLRIVYAGVFPGNPPAPNSNPCTEATPSRSAVSPIIGRCDAPARKELIASWGKLFQEGTCSSGACPTGLRHAFRRDDASGTTDVFLTLLGLPALTRAGTTPAGGCTTNAQCTSATTGTGNPEALCVQAVCVLPNRPFCNGTEQEDLDPVRTACPADATGTVPSSENVCGALPYASRNWDLARQNGETINTTTNPAPAPSNPAAGVASDLGVVLAVSVPASNVAPAGTAYNTTFCSTGQFRQAAMPAAGPLRAQLCPNGNARQGNRCRWPVIAASAAVPGDFRCVNRSSNRALPAIWTRYDARAHNLLVRDAAGALVNIGSEGTPSAAYALSRTVGDQVFFGNAFYRIHEVNTLTNATASAVPCTQPDSTEQIGCLVQADACSIGYAGRAALAWSGTEATSATKSLNIRTPADASVAVNAADENAIRNLLLAQGGSAPACSSDFGRRYPLARSLWINSAKGFGATVGSADNAFPNLTNATVAPAPENEQAFLQWIVNNKTLAGTGLDAVLTARDFVTIPGGASALDVFQCASATTSSPTTQIR